MSRVLIVAPSFPPEARTGRAAAFARLAERLDDHVETRLVVGYTGDRARIPQAALGVRMGESSRLGHLLLWRAAREAAGAFRPDRVVVSGLSLPPLLWPTVAVVRDLVGRGWRPMESVRFPRVRARAPRRVVVPTQHVREAVKGLGVDRWRIERIPDVVDVPAEPPPQARRKGRLEVLHPGTIHPAKAQHVSIDAVSRLPATVKPHVHLVVAGDPADHRYLAQLRVAAEGQPIDIVTDGSVLAAATRRAHLVLYPTALDEGFPDAAVTALATARPVVWSDRPALREVLEGSGLPVPPANVGAVRDTIVSALDLDLEAIGAQGHATALARFSWKALWPRWRMVLAAWP